MVRGLSTPSTRISSMSLVAEGPEISVRASRVQPGERVG